MLSPGTQPHADFTLVTPDLVPDPLWFARAQSDVIELNSACVTLLGCARIIAVEAVREMIHPDDRAHVCALWAGAKLDGLPFEVEFRIRAAEGRYRHVFVRAAWHASDTGAYCIGILSGREDAYFSREREALLAAAAIG